MKKIKIWIEAIRLRTLPVSASGVVIAIALAVYFGESQWLPAVLCLMFALLAQIVSNLANEYYDYLRGADKKGRVGPRRGVTEGDIDPITLRRVTYATLALACAVGCTLLLWGPWWLLLVGMAVAVGALIYSTGPYPLSYHALGEVAVFVFFGIVPVNLTYYLQAGNFNAFAVLASIAIGLMGVNVLLVNNYRDMEDDIEAGKRTSVVVFGRKLAATAYLINGYVAISVLSPLWLRLLLGGYWWGLAPAVVYLAAHSIGWYKLVTRSGAQLNALLGATARAMLVFTLLLTLVLVLAQ
ncbi:MAG: 1,4-dihydroxy-2-naphthoate octaprenyltransferase [Muribaculaceae bacterium]